MACFSGIQFASDPIGADASSEVLKDADHSDAQPMNRDANDLDAGFPLNEDAKVVDAGPSSCDGPTIRLCPSEPKTDQNLYVDFSGDCDQTPSPPPADCSYTYKWFKTIDSSSTLAQETSTQVLNAMETSKNEEWYVEIHEGNELIEASTPTTIRNSAPTGTQFELEREQLPLRIAWGPHYPGDYARLDDVYRCKLTVAAADRDGDQVTHSIHWEDEQGAVVSSTLSNANAGDGQELDLEDLNLPNGARNSYTCVITATDDDLVDPQSFTSTTSIEVCQQEYVTMVNEDYAVMMFSPNTGNTGTMSGGYWHETSGTYNYQRLQFSPRTTLEVWVRWESSPTTGGYVYHRHNSAGTPSTSDDEHVALIIEENGRVRFEIAGTEGQATTNTVMTLTSTSSLPVDSWAHLAVVLDGTPTLFINGQSEALGSRITPTIIDPNPPSAQYRHDSTSLGRPTAFSPSNLSSWFTMDYNYDEQNSFVGSIAEFRITTRALTPSIPPIRNLSIERPTKIFYKLDPSDAKYISNTIAYGAFWDSLPPAPPTIRGQIGETRQSGQTVNTPSIDPMQEQRCLYPRP